MTTRMLAALLAALCLAAPAAAQQAAIVDKVIEQRLAELGVTEDGLGGPGVPGTFNPLVLQNASGHEARFRLTADAVVAFDDGAGGVATLRDPAGRWSLGINGLDLDGAKSVTWGSDLRITQGAAAGLLKIYDPSNSADAEVRVYDDAGTAYSRLQPDGLTLLAPTTDTAPSDLSLTAPSAFSSASTNQDGGDLVLTPGAAASGGGTAGRVIVRQPGGVAGTDEITFSHDGANGFVDVRSGDLLFKARGTEVLRVQSGSIAFSQPLFSNGNGAYLWMTELSADPSAPASNYGLLYFKDNGAGKTQLVARFATGAVQVIATEP